MGHYQMALYSTFANSWIDNNIETLDKAKRVKERMKLECDCANLLSAFTNKMNRLKYFLVITFERLKAFRWMVECP